MLPLTPLPTAAQGSHVETVVTESIPLFIGAWTQREAKIWRVTKMISEWGRVVLFGDQVMNGTHTWEGACVVREDGRIMASRRLAGNVCMINGDKLCLNFAINWQPDSNINQWLNTINRMPAPRKLSQGFEPALVADKGPFLLEEDINTFKLWPTRGSGL